MYSVAKDVVVVCRQEGIKPILKTHLQNEFYCNVLRQHSTPIDANDSRHGSRVVIRLMSSRSAHEKTVTVVVKRLYITQRKIFSKTFKCNLIT